MQLPYKMYKDLEGNIHHLLQGEPQESWVEYIPPAEFALPQLFETPYNVKRAHSYPQLGEQLDMLWHELNTNGSISVNGDWFNAIKEVKEAHPKP